MEKNYTSYELKEYILRCELLGVKPILDNIWLLCLENDEIYLDYTYLWDEDEGADFFNRYSVKEEVIQNIKENNGWLKIPDGITKLKGGCFNRNPLLGFDTKLDLNEVNEVRSGQFSDITYLSGIKGNNVERVHDNSFIDLPYIQVIELLKLSIKDFSYHTFVRVNKNCKLYLDDITTTMSMFKTRTLKMCLANRKGK